MIPALPLITAGAAGVLLLLQTLLMLTAALVRRGVRQALGDTGEHPGLTRAVRRHGNLAENAAIFLIGSALLEMLGGERLLVESLCGAFIFARLLHAFGLSLKNTVNPFRVLGVILTVAVDATLAVTLIRIAARIYLSK
jgi:uncharacterized membrane protein YecN with MAPEG domain